MKRRKRTTKKIPAKGRLRDMADQLWSLAVRDDWGHRCAVCCLTRPQAHHLIPRQHEATRYDLRNGIALCASHHQFDPDVSPHQNAAGWMDWLAEHHPLRHNWYVETVESGEHRSFDGTKNVDHYVGVIGTLRSYVQEVEFERIVGIRFADHLDTV